MSVTQLLFNPNGRTGQRDFLRGAILLTGFLIIAMVIEAYGPVLLSAMVSLLTLGTLYCYLCVYGKRLHDSGRSAWYFLVFLGGFFVFSNIFNALLLMIFAPGAAELTEEMWYLLQRGETREAMGHMSVINKMTIIPRMITLIAANAFLAYVGAKLISDPVANQHGEPTDPGDVIL